MISLVLSMIRARWAQALTVWVLSLFATASAVAGPVALRTVDEAIVHHEVAAAAAPELTVSLRQFTDPTETEVKRFEAITKLFALPGFQAIRSGEIEVFGPVPDGTRAAYTPSSRVVYRDRVCEHVTITSGRCLAGALEVIVGEDLARRVGLRAGDVAVVQAARYESGGLVPDGEEERLTVVGIYRPNDPNEAYWASQFYFPVLPDGTRREALFVSPQTIDLIQHREGELATDLVALPSAFTVERLEDLQAKHAQAMESFTADDALDDVTVASDLPLLLQRIERSRALAHQLVPVAFVPLVALSWFVLYLAVGYGVFGRRSELGLVALRGLTRPRRWWLATGETVGMIVLGAPAGYLLGHLAVQAVGRMRLGVGEAAGLTLDSVPHAGVALAGGLAVALIGEHRSLREPVLDLLRQVPRRERASRAAAVALVLALLAVGATAQLRTTQEGLVGVSLLVPGLVVVAVAALAACVTGPVVNAVARWALQRGWLGTGLAAVQFARRHGTQQLFVLLALTAAMLPFVAAAFDVAERARAEGALILTGATRVATVESVDVRRLLDATRTADPQGAWAMAALPVGQRGADAPRLLAVDATRLAAVAEWRDNFGPSAAEVAAMLAAPSTQPFLLTGRALRVDVEVLQELGQPPVDVVFQFVPRTGGRLVEASVAGLGAGRVTRQVPVGDCAEGCRLVNITVPTSLPENVRLILHAVKQVDPDGDVIPPEQLRRPSRWRASDAVNIGSFGATAMQLSVQRLPFDSGETVVAPADVLLPIPVVATQSRADVDEVSGLDGHLIGARVEATLAMLPRLGTDGALVDLEYAELAAMVPPRGLRAEVWLGPSAPADAVERLREAGLAISAVRTAQESRAVFNRQGPALALQFHLAAAAFAVVLGLGGLSLVALVESPRRRHELTALRVQGLRPRFVTRAVLWGYVSVVVAAAATGLLAAACAWMAAGDRLPVFTDPTEVLRPPSWPRPSVSLSAWTGVTGAMVVSAVVAAWSLRRSVARVGKG